MSDSDCQSMIQFPKLALT